MGQHLVVPSIGGRDVTRAEGPYVGGFEHLLQLLNLINNAFNVHASLPSKSIRELSLLAYLICQSSSSLSSNWDVRTAKGTYLSNGVFHDRKKSRGSTENTRHGWRYTNVLMTPGKQFADPCWSIISGVLYYCERKT